MTLPQNSGCALAHPNQIASTINPVLEAAGFEAGMHPDRIEAIATDLGIGKEQPAPEEYNGNDVIRAGELAPIVDTAHHEALGFLAHWRELGSEDDHFPYRDLLSGHQTYLAHSPHFRSFLEEAKEERTSGDPNWNLAVFAAQMCAVGVLIARREFGRRAPTPYDIELDQVTRIDVPFAEIARLQREGGAR